MKLVPSKDEIVPVAFIVLVTMFAVNRIAFLKSLVG